MTTATARLTADEFFTGLFAALALRGRPAISIRGDRFDKILARIFDELRVKADAEDIDLRFRIRPHRIHGDSPTVRAAVKAATQADLISLDNPEYQDIRFKIGREDAEFFLASLPLPKDVFDWLAESFLDQYDAPSDITPTAA
jgi:hypothetical protein